MSNCSPMPTPLSSQPDKVPAQDKVFENLTYFRSFASKLQYLTLTRPDLPFAVNYVCQMMHMPTEADFILLKRILMYVKGILTWEYPLAEIQTSHYRFIVTVTRLDVRKSDVQLVDSAVFSVPI